MASIVDVAKLAEVAVATVSRVINNDPRVRPRTRRAVEQAMAELGYARNEGARSLRMARTRTIGYAAMDLSDPLFMRFVSGVESIVRANGYSLILCDSALDREEEVANLRRLYERRVEGLIIHPVGGECPELSLFIRAGIPIVAGLYADVGVLPPEVHHMSADMASGMQEAVQHLADLGHRRIAFFVYSRVPYEERVEEFRRLVEKAGLVYDPNLVVFCDASKSCVDAAKELFSRTERPTAAICASYPLMPYIFGGITALGLAVPDDVSFITVGDLRWTEFHNPPLTCVYYDQTAYGQMKAEYLFACIEGEDASGVIERYRPALTSRLEIRASTAMPRETAYS